MFNLAQRYIYLTFLCIGVLLGFYFCLLFSGCGHPLHQPAVTHIAPPVPNKTNHWLQKTYEARIDSFMVATQHLRGDLQSTRRALDKAKQKNQTLQYQVLDLLDRTATNLPDTVARIIVCDSLELKVKDLLAGDSIRDSLYEAVTVNLETQILRQDSTIRLQGEQCHALDSLYRTAVASQQTTETENRSLRRQVKRQKRLGLIKTIGLAIAAVFATHYLTHP